MATWGRGLAAALLLSAASARAVETPRAATLVPDQHFNTSPDALTRSILAAQIADPVNGGVVSARVDDKGSVTYQGKGTDANLGLPKSPVRVQPAKAKAVEADAKVPADLKDSPHGAPVKAHDQLKRMAVRRASWR